MRKSILAFCFLVLLALACTSSQILQPLSPFEQTRAMLIDTATAYAFVPSQEATVFQTVDPSIDPFSLTATSIVATATAQVFVLDTACKNLHVITHFYYSDANNYQEPLVYDWGHGPYLCDSNWNPPFRYEIEIGSINYIAPEWRLIQILEDAVSRLPDYPPFDGNTSAEIQVISYLMRGTMWYGSFSYSEGIAAYESGLRGADLASALGMEGIDLTATVVVEEMLELETAIARDYAMFSIQQTETILATATASSPLSFAETRQSLIATTTAQSFPTVTSQLSIFQTHAATDSTDSFILTAISIIETATVVIGTPENCHLETFVSSSMYYTINADGVSLSEPQIYNDARESLSCETNSGLPANYAIILEIDNAAPQVDIEQMVFVVLEDAVARLPDYPPFDERVQNVGIGICFAAGGWCTAYGDFTYSEALAAYESGLRGADLAEVLGVRAP